MQDVHSDFYQQITESYRYMKPFFWKARDTMAFLEKAIKVSR